MWSAGSRKIQGNSPRNFGGRMLNQNKGVMLGLLGIAVSGALLLAGQAPQQGGAPAGAPALPPAGGQDPGDWLLIRRDHSATNYSPLNQITRDNAKDLQLAFKVPMREGGTNQPAPIAHNGVIYLPNIGGVLQAIDGTSGKIIWESTVGGSIDLRGISIYQNNLYMMVGTRIVGV